MQRRGSRHVCDADYMVPNMAAIAYPFSPPFTSLQSRPLSVVSLAWELSLYNSHAQDDSVSTDNSSFNLCRTLVFYSSPTPRQLLPPFLFTASPTPSLSLLSLLVKLPIPTPKQPAPSLDKLLPSLSDYCLCHTIPSSSQHSPTAFPTSFLFIPPLCYYPPSPGLRSQLIALTLPFFI